MVTAFVVPADPAAPPGRDELLAFAAERLAAFKRPRIVHVRGGVAPQRPRQGPEARAAAMSAAEGGPMDVDLAGRTAIVTGGASGIGGPAPAGWPRPGPR